MADKKVILPEDLDQIVEKWLPVIEGTGKWEKTIDGMPKVDSEKYELMATQLEILEQTELAESTDTTGTAAMNAYKPILIPMVRRVLPGMIGSDLFGTQPMTGPSGLIFSLRALYQGDAEDAPGSSFEIVQINAEVAELLVPDADITGDVAGEGTVVHGEGTFILVKLTSAATTFAGDANVDDAATYAASVATVTKVFPDAEALARVLFKNFTGSMSTADGEYLGIKTKELGFTIDSATVTARTRKLKTRWTTELEDDLRAVHGLNAEQLLSGFCGDEIVREMNREFVDKVHDYAVVTTDDGMTVATWTYDTATGVQGRTENERYQSLGNFIMRQARRMAKSNLRGPANYMIVTLPILTCLEAIGFKASGKIDPLKQPKVGTWQGMDVYVDMFPTESGDYILLGYKGDDIDAGFYYCPYIPLKVNKGYGEEDNIPRLFFSTRYGLGENPFGAKNYFSKIVVDLGAVSGGAYA